MAKKKTSKGSGSDLDAFKGAAYGITSGIPSDASDLLNSLPDIPGMDEEEKINMMMMLTLMHLGVTPEEYAEVYKMYDVINKSGLLDMLEGQHADNAPARKTRRKPGSASSASGKISKEKTLVLKIQLKGITKPPMWREVEVPADYTFSQLNDIIQAVSGLEHSHLWQFQEKAYRSHTIIGEKADPNDPFHRGLDHVSHEAEKTPITKFLNEKGDKIEYIYDFGDDWIFSIEVKNILNNKSYHPVCTTYKSEMNIPEDSGGIWGYQRIRQAFSTYDMLNEEDREKTREELLGGWYDSDEEVREFFDELRFNLNEVNSQLSII